MEEQNMRDIVKLMNKIKTAIEMMHEKQLTISSLEKTRENETRPLIIEKMKQDIEKAKKDKKEFDKITTDYIINAKLTIQKLRDELEKEYKNILLEKIEKERKLEEKVNAMKMRETSSDRLLHIEEIAKKSEEKIKEETDEYSKKHFVKINKLNEFDQNLKDWSIELNVVDIFNNAELNNKEDITDEKNEIKKDIQENEENNLENKNEKPGTDVDKSFDDLKKELDEQFKKLQEDIEKGFEIPELSSLKEHEVKEEKKSDEKGKINIPEETTNSVENIENNKEETKNSIDNIFNSRNISDEIQYTNPDFNIQNIETTKTLTTVDKNNEKSLPAISFSEVLAKINTVYVSSFAYSVYKAANKKIDFKNKSSIKKLATIPSFIGKLISKPINYALRTNAKIYEIKDNIEQLSNEEFTVLTEKPEVANKYGQTIKNEFDQTLSDKNVMKDRHVNDAILDMVQERLEDKYSKNSDLYSSKINEINTDIKNYEEYMKTDSKNADTYNINIETLKNRKEAWEKEIKDQDKRLETYKKNKRIKEAYRNNPDVRKFDQSLGQVSQKLREAKKEGNFIYENQLSKVISDAMAQNKNLHENKIIQKIFYGEDTASTLKIDMILNKANKEENSKDNNLNLNIDENYR